MNREAVICAQIESGPVVWLHLDHDSIALEIASDLRSPQTTTLRAGRMEDVLQILRHEPPTAIELEAAIAAIEDAITPTVASLPPRARLIISAAEIAELADVASIASGTCTRLELAKVEAWFNRLADMAHRTPPAVLGVSSSRAFAARVLVLRELMHHAGFDAVIVVS